MEDMGPKFATHLQQNLQNIYNKIYIQQNLYNKIYIQKFNFVSYNFYQLCTLFKVSFEHFYVKLCPYTLIFCVSCLHD